MSAVKSNVDGRDLPLPDWLEMRSPYPSQQQLKLASIHHKHMHITIYSTHISVYGIHTLYFLLRTASLIDRICFRPENPRPVMAQYYPQQAAQQPYGVPPQQSAQNLQFYPTSYSSVSGHTTPSQATYGGYGLSSSSAPAFPIGGGGSGGPGGSGAAGGYGGGGYGSSAAGVSGRMGEQGGLRTGWLAAFGTEGYEGEPPLLEELGVNFEHIRTKVGG